LKFSSSCGKFILTKHSRGGSYRRFRQEELRIIGEEGLQPSENSQEGSRDYLESTCK